MAAKKKVTKKRRAKPQKVTGEQSVTTTCITRPKSINDYFIEKTGELRNPRHELFAQKWAMTFDRREALKAGKYKDPKSAANLRKQSDSILRRVEVQKRIRAILRDQVTDMAVTENWVILKMLDVYEKAMEQKPILARNEDGEPEVVGYEYQDLRVAMTTLKELGINMGMFQKKDEKKVPSVTINMNYGSDQKVLQAPIEGKARRLN